jgi:hypothetical protein
MPDDEIEIRAVLDSSAMLSYARGHVHVGELVVDIAEEGAYVALPTVTMVRAYADVGTDEQARARLALLPTVPGIHVLPLGPGEAITVATYVGQVADDLARAHAVWATLIHGAYFLTSEPEPVMSAIPVDQIHYIPTDDA